MSEAGVDGGGVGREAWLSRLSELFSGWGAGPAEELRRRFDASLEGFDDADFARFAERLQTTGDEFGFHAHDPVARSLSRAAHGLIALDGSGLLADSLTEADPERPLVFLGNHLSFIDANTFDWMLDKAGRRPVADRLTVLAGPKVYSEPIRRLASLCFGTIKIPQSRSRASGEAVMSRREVLRLAMQTLAQVRTCRERGDHVLVFAEGSRSRSGGMQRVLPAVVRYLEEPWATIVPFGLTGTEKLVPLGEDHAYPSVVQGRLGAPVSAGALFEAAQGKRTVVADAIGFLISGLLPDGYRGCYSDELDDEALVAAREVAMGVTEAA